MTGARERPRQARLASCATAALAATALVVGQVGVASAADPPGGETIYFWRMSDASQMAVRPDGSGLTALGCSGERTFGGAPRRVLRLEATGDRFQGWIGSGTWWTFDVERVVSSDEQCGDPVVLWAPGPGYALDSASWSVDGRRVAVSARHFDTGGQLLEQGLWVGEIDAGCGAALCDVHLAVALPMWPTSGPGGDLVAYASFPVIPSWSSDGRHVTYARAPDLGSPSGVFVADVGLPGDSTVRADIQVPIAGTHPYDQTYPVFSPVAGSDLIAYSETTSMRGTPRGEVFVIPATGGTPRQVTSTKTTSSYQIAQPSWSPDGRSIAFAGSYGGSGNGIWRIAADGRSKAVLVAGAKTWIYASPRWRP
jgi:WD40-like Beta Propeller Repeat